MQLAAFNQRKRFLCLAAAWGPQRKPKPLRSAPTTSGPRMTIQLSLDALIEYTDWQRQKWRAVLQQQGPGILRISAGPHGDGRFQAVGELIRHIFSAEKRYIERLSGRSLTDTASIAADNIDTLFAFGQQSRRDLTEFVRAFPVEQWEVPQEFTLLNTAFRVTPRKVVFHVLVHEIRHWAQIATLLRLHGVTGEFQDFLFSPALGGEFRPAPTKR